MSHQFTSSLRRWSVVLAVALSAALIVPATALAGGAPGTVPTITSPANASTITASPLTVTATSTATQVRFTLDAGGVLVAQTVSVSAGTATADLQVYGLAGIATLSAADCLTGACNLTEDSIGVTIDLPAPMITAPTKNRVVGNSVTVKATAPGGSLQFLLDGNAVDTDLSAPFEKTLSLDGKSQGDHTIKVKQCDLAGTICQGATDTRTVIKDTQGPKFYDLSTSQRTVFPAKDNYKDTTKLAARVSEESLETKIEIRKAGGPLVRTLKLGRVDQGRVSSTWNGRKSNGNIVPAGKYLFRFVGTDVNGVTGKSNDKAVNVSDKKLERRQVTKTVTALGSIGANGSGQCSDVFRLNYKKARFDWPKGLGYYSNAYCSNGASDSVALGVHVAGLNNATRYGSFSLEAYGAGAFRHAGPAAMLTIKSNDGIGAKKRLGTSAGWYGVKGLDVDKYLKKGKLRWAVGTTNGNWYDVKEFRIAYTYFVLR